MIQLKVYESPAKLEQTFLDLYETEPIKLTLSIEDITNADATSTFSKTFKVPGTRKNFNFFKNAFDVDGTLFDVTIKKPAEILVDGAEFKQGHIRLQKVYVNTELDKIDYELVFLGETRNFSSLVGERTLCELQMPDLIGGSSGALTEQDIVDSWLAYPADIDVNGNAIIPSLSSGLHNGNIIYPLIDHGNTYDSAGNAEQTRIATDSSNNFTQNSHPLLKSRLKPMIRAKRIWDQIFDDAGYDYTSDFINSAKFQSIYISAFGNNPTIGWDAEASSTNSDNIAHGERPTSSIYGQKLTTNINDPGGNFVNVTYSGQQATAYKIPQAGSYSFSVSAYWEGLQEDSDYTISYVNAEFRLYNLTTSTILTSTIVQSGTNGQLTGTFVTGTTPNFSVGNEIVFVIIPLSALSNELVEDVVYDVLSAPGQFNPISALDCQYKQIDFIKDILTAFRLVLAPDPKNPLNFIVEPWQEYINSGDLHDWSHRLVENRDMQIEPIFYSQSSEIEFTYLPGGDYTNIYHQQATDHPYGWLRFSSANELLTGKREVKFLGLAPTPISVIEGGDTDYVLPQLHTHSAEDTGLQHLPIKPKTRMLFYNGLQPVGVGWYLSGWSSNPIEYYPLVSPYEAWPIQPSTLNLNFSNDIQYWGEIPGYNGNGSTLYTDYWSRYIESLYNKYTRRVTAQFILNNIDLNEFSFDDTIFVNGTYYRPEKIIDVQIGAYTEVTVQLITANDYRPKAVLDENLTGLSAVGVSPNCSQKAGYIEVTTNGTPPFTWTLNTGATGTALVGTAPGLAPYTFTIPGVTAGTYTIDVVDSLGRTGTTTATVSLPAFTNVQATYSITPATNCQSPCNGSITVNTPTGGTAPYTIEWSDDPFNTSFTRTGLCPYGYSFRVLDANQCSSPYYYAPVECAPTNLVYEMRQLNLNCSLNFNTRYVESVVPLNIGDVWGLVGEEESLNCWKVIATSTEIPDAYLLASYADCESCTGGITSDNWEDQLPQWENDTDQWENA